MRMASGPDPPDTSAAMAAATGTPGRAPPRSPTSCTVVAPYSPRAAAIDAVSAPQATASTVPATDRASVSSSKVMGAGPESPASARTQILVDRHLRPP